MMIMISIVHQLSWYCSSIVVSSSSMFLLEVVVVVVEVQVSIT